MIKICPNVDITLWLRGAALSYLCVNFAKTKSREEDGNGTPSNGALRYCRLEVRQHLVPVSHLKRAVDPPMTCTFRRRGL